jgi:hypothetical protein
MLRLVRAVMVRSGVARHPVIQGWAWRDGEHAMRGRGHPPRWNKRAQE